MTRVWITRDEPPDGPLASAVAAVGLVPVSEPVLETLVVADASDEIARLEAGDWLVLTSQRAVEAVALGPARTPRVAVVGEVSASAARRRGLRVEFVSPTGSGAGLWAHLAENAKGRRVCFPRSSLAAVPDLPGIDLVAPILYETRSRRFDSAIASRADVVALASPSAVRSVLERLGSLPLPAASIGPSTSAAVRSAGGALLVEARERDFASLARAIARATSAG